MWTWVWLTVWAAPLSPSQVVAQAQAESPLLIGARARVQVAKGQQTIADRWIANNPQLGVEWATDVIFDDEGDGILRLGLQQQLEIFGQPGLRSDWAGLLRASAEERLRALELQVAHQAASGCVNLAGARRRRVVAQEAAALAGRIAQVAAQRQKAGEGSDLELSQARIDAARAEANFASAEAEVVRAEAQLSLLLGRRIEVETSTFSWRVPTGSISALADQAQKARPDLRAAARAVEANHAEAALLSRSRLPNPTFTLGLEREQLHLHGALPSSGEDFAVVHSGWALNLALSVPLPAWDRRQGELEANLGRQRGAEAERAALSRRAEIEVESAQLVLQQASRAQRRYAAALPEVARSLAWMERGYRQGELGLDLLLAQRDRALRTRVEAIQAEVDQGLALIGLYQALGQVIGAEEK
ncbi:MAG: TolC family protein [Deltaproteobacteria bacterium]|nr:TolC family protein [Deltaproteobacteria bacterium]